MHIISILRILAVQWNFACFKSVLCKYWPLVYHCHEDRRLNFGNDLHVVCCSFAIYNCENVPITGQLQPTVVGFYPQITRLENLAILFLSANQLDEEILQLMIVLLVVMDEVCGTIDRKANLTNLFDTIIFVIKSQLTVSDNDGYVHAVLLAIQWKQFRGLSIKFT
ncbi:hypothetical protein T01_3161 [Trichinella spiralis]|uniref:Uncharacterized protein n=1 Tax=Trichinella spiralis TaxID=6334 RepID=A0A0V1B7R7_TRISP|nr:hypothetical protein T01_3161 [Trichinella spiralis]